MKFTPKAIKPDAVYEGKVYTQTVVAELPNGLEVRLEDPRKRITEDDIGELLVGTLVGQSVRPINENSAQEIGVEPSVGISVTVTGQVTDVTQHVEYPIVLELSFGELSIDFPNTDAVAPGDWISVPDVRLYLEQVKRR